MAAKTRKAINKRQNRKTRTRKQRGGIQNRTYILVFEIQVGIKEHDENNNQNNNYNYEQIYEQAKNTLNDVEIWREYIKSLMNSAFHEKERNYNKNYNIPVENIKIWFFKTIHPDNIEGIITWESLNIENQYIESNISDIIDTIKMYEFRDEDDWEIVEIDAHLRPVINEMMVLPVPKGVENIASLEPIQNNNVIINMLQGKNKNGKKKYTSNYLKDTEKVLTEKSYRMLDLPKKNPFTGEPITERKYYKAKLV
jgi:hypothetical protein